MSTSFEVLFDEFLNTEINSLTLSQYTPPTLSRYLTILLTRAREEFYNLVYSNSSSINNKMDDVIDYYSQEFNFTVVASTPTNIFNLSPLPKSGSNLYVTVNNVEITNYTYNSTTGNIQMDNLSVGSEVQVVAFLNGQFNQTLSLIERGILTDWLGCLFLKDKIKQERLYNQAIFGKDEEMTSQANHLKSLNDIFNDALKNVKTKTFEYTYRNNPDHLSQLGAKGGVINRGLL